MEFFESDTTGLGVSLGRAGDKVLVADVEHVTLLRTGLDCVEGIDDVLVVLLGACEVVRCVQGVLAVMMGGYKD